MSDILASSVNAAQTLYQSAKIPVVLTDIQGNITFKNDVFKQDLCNGGEPQVLKEVFKDLNLEELLLTICQGEDQARYLITNDQNKHHFQLTSIFGEGALIGVLFKGYPHSQNILNSKAQEVIPKYLEQLRDPIFHLFNIFTILYRRLEEKEMYHEIEFLDNAQKNCYKLLKETRNIAEFLNTSQGHHKDKIQLVNLDTFLADIVANAHLLLSNAKRQIVHIKYEQQYSVIPVEMNVDHLSIMLLNLILNSCIYSLEECNIEIKLSKTGKNAVITVKDDGVGIESDEINKIFDPLYSTDEDFKNLGLGLPLVKEICTMYGGMCMVSSAHEYQESDKEIGTSFTVRLPLANVQNKSTSFKSSPSSYKADKLSLVNIYLSEIFYREV